MIIADLLIDWLQRIRHLKENLTDDSVSFYKIKLATSGLKLVTREYE
jgi:hypothetical protein